MKSANAYPRGRGAQAFTSWAYSNIGINYYYLGRFEDAAVMFREAAKLAPKNFQFWGNLGDALCCRLPDQAT